MLKFEYQTVQNFTQVQLKDIQIHLWILEEKL